MQRMLNITSDAIKSRTIIEIIYGGVKFPIRIAINVTCMSFLLTREKPDKRHRMLVIEDGYAFKCRNTLVVISYRAKYTKWLRVI